MVGEESDGDVVARMRGNARGAKVACNVEGELDRSNRLDGNSGLKEATRGFPGAVLWYPRCGEGRWEPAPKDDTPVASEAIRKGSAFGNSW